MTTKQHTQTAAFIAAGILLASLGTIVLTQTQLAEAQNSSQGHHSRVVWTSTRGWDDQMELTNAELEGSQSTTETKDWVVIHLGPGVTLTQEMIDNAEAVTKVPNSRVAVEVFSLADMEANAELVDDAGFGGISYDLEPVASPDAESSDPVQAFTDAKAITDAAGISLYAAPSRGITTDHGADIAPLVNRYHIQSQALQNADTQCLQMVNYVADMVDTLEAANSNLEGRISFQVALVDSRQWPGDPNVLTTAKKCVNKMMVNAQGSDVDGISIFWSGPHFDDGFLQNLLNHSESTYSSN